MFGPDPIDLYDPSPYGALAYYGHIIIGCLALLGAVLALTSRKGSQWHKRGGYLFFGSVVVVCATSFAMLAEALIPPLVLATFTAIYCVAGALLALQKDETIIRIGEVGFSLFLIYGIGLFLADAIPVARMGLIPPFAPAVIIFIPVVLLIGDINWYRNWDRRPELRIRRHLSRMIWATVVVFRAPLVELAAAGLPISQTFTIFGPILLGFAMLWYFLRKHPVRSGAT